MIFFETFWVNSSGWFECPGTLKKNHLFLLFSLLFIFSFILPFIFSSSCLSSSSCLASSLFLSSLFSSLDLLFSCLFSSLLFHLLVSSHFLSRLLFSCLVLSLCLSLFLSVSVSVSLCLCLRVVLCVLCCVVCCDVMCCVWCVARLGTQKKPTCVDSKRPCVNRHHAHMCYHMRAWCRHTWGRFQSTHGGFWDGHTEERGERRERGGGVTVSSANHETAHVESSRASERFTERSPWFLPIQGLRTGREQHVLESSNHSLYLTKLLSSILS